MLGLPAPVSAGGVLRKPGIIMSKRWSAVFLDYLMMLGKTLQADRHASLAMTGYAVIGVAHQDDVAICSIKKSWV